MSASWRLQSPTHRRSSWSMNWLKSKPARKASSTQLRVESPAEVDEVVPVPACEDEPPLAAWLPVDVVVPVCAIEAPAPAWLPEFVVVPVCALALPFPAWLPLDVVVPV